MSVEIAWKQNILVTDSYLLKLLLVVLGFGLQAFVCDFSRQNICSEPLNQVQFFIHIHFLTYDRDERKCARYKSCSLSEIPV